MFSRIGNFILSANTSLHVIGLMAFLPFIVAYHQLPIPSFYGEWVAGFLGVIALFPLLKRESWQPLELPQISLVFPGLMAIVFIQWLLGMLHSVQYALLVASYLAWAFLLVVLGNHLRHQLGWEKLVKTIAWYLIAGGLINVIFVLMQYATKAGFELPYFPSFSGVGAVGQGNHLANYTMLAGTSLIYLFLKHRLSKVTLAVIGVLFLSMLAFSGSRSSWLYLIAITSLAVLFRVMCVRQFSSTTKLQINQSRILFRLALLLLPIFAIIQVLITLLLGNLIALPTERLIAELGGTTPVGGLAIRLHIWHESILLFLQSPWLGVGIGQTRWMSFITPDTHWLIDFPGSYEHAHNLVIQLLAEMGVGAALVLLAGVFSWLRGFQWRHINLESWWLLSLLAIIGIHSMLEYPLWYAYFLGLTAILSGAGEEKQSQLRFPFIGRIIVAASMVCAMSVMSSLLVAHIKLEQWVSRGIRGQITENNQSEFFNDLGWVSQKSLLVPYTHLVYALAITPNEKHLEDKLWLSQAALRFIPMRTTAYRHVLLLELSGKHTEAVHYMKSAIQAYPKDFKRELQNLPREYWDLYLRIFEEAVDAGQGQK